MEFLINILQGLLTTIFACVFFFLLCASVPAFALDKTETKRRLTGWLFIVGFILLSAVLLILSNIAFTFTDETFINFCGVITGMVLPIVITGIVGNHLVNNPANDHRSKKYLMGQTYHDFFTEDLFTAVNFSNAIVVMMCLVSYYPIQVIIKYSKVNPLSFQERLFD